MIGGDCLQVSEVTLLNTALGESIVFSQESSTHILEICDLSNIPSEMSTQKRVAADGVLVTSVKLSPRTISLVVWLVGENDEQLSTYRRSLSRLINPKQPIRLLQNGYAIEGYPLHTIAVGTDRNVMNDRMCRIYIELYCAFPLFTTEETSSAAIASWENKLTFPLNFTNNQIIFGLRSSVLIAAISNFGDVECGAKFYVAAKGKVINPRIINIATQTYMEFSLTLMNEDQLVIDTTGEIPVVLLNGESVVSSLTEDSGQLVLPVGLSDISYSAEGGSEAMEVRIEVNPLFLEVL